MSSQGNPCGLPEFLLDADYTEGWQDLFPQALRIETIACDHFSLLDDPHRQQAATMIREFFAAKPGNGKIRQTVRTVVETEIRRVLVGLPEDAICPKVSLTELGAHSIDRAEVATAAMEKLDVVVPLTALAQVNDIDGLVELLTDYAGRGG